jgi:hypothetical protein
VCPDRTQRAVHPEDHDDELADDAPVQAAENEQKNADSRLVVGDRTDGPMTMPIRPSTKTTWMTVAEIIVRNAKKSRMKLSLR